MKKKAVLLSLGLHVGIVGALLADPVVTLVQPGSSVVLLTLQTAGTDMAASPVHAVSEDKAGKSTPHVSAPEPQHEKEMVTEKTVAQPYGAAERAPSADKERMAPLQRIVAGAVKTKVSKTSVTQRSEQENIVSNLTAKKLYDPVISSNNPDAGRQDTVIAQSASQVIPVESSKEGGRQNDDNQGKAAKIAEQRYLGRHFEHIRQRILDHLVFPAVAKKMRWSGQMVVSFIIKTDGKVEQVKVESSSGYTILDSKVVATINDIQPYPAPPVQAKLRIPVAFSFVN
ncbi:energy transducer TonB [Desulfogranum japonicum]|uniref:energy transducer TonB n=1 Tax=Desulfogranum japonicum TaxID=231447 RepID=UPI0003F7F557|nr:energy transducer TonB [Desulfogranum japonicum]